MVPLSTHNIWFGWEIRQLITWYTVITKALIHAIYLQFVQNKFLISFYDILFMSILTSSSSLQPPPHACIVALFWVKKTVNWSNIHHIAFKPPWTVLVAQILNMLRHGVKLIQTQIVLTIWIWHSLVSCSIWQDFWNFHSNFCSWLQTVYFNAL